MSLPILLPAWIPWWVPFLVLALGVLYLLVFLLMPFSVFGLKGRLDGIEARLDEMHTELRRLALRLPEPAWNGPYEEEPVTLPLSRRRPVTETTRPPIPPAPQVPTVDSWPGSVSASAGREQRDPRAQRMRAEPRLDWPP